MINRLANASKPFFNQEKKNISGDTYYENYHQREEGRNFTRRNTDKFILPNKNCGDKPINILLFLLLFVLIFSFLVENLGEHLISYKLCGILCLFV